MHCFQEFETPKQKWFIGHVVDRKTPGILIHQFLKALKPLNRKDVAWGYGSAHDFIATHFVGLERSIDLFATLLDLLIRDNNLLVCSLADIFHCGFCGKTTFCERPRGERVRSSAQRISCTKQTFNGHHPVIAPEILARRYVFWPTGPRARARCMGAHDVRL